MKFIHFLRPTEMNATNEATVMSTNIKPSKLMRKQDREERFCGATHSLTRVWTLGRLEAGCFYFHVLQHNNVYKNGVNMIRGHMGETALHGNVAPPFLPSPRSQHQSIKYAKTDPGRVSLKAPQCKSRLCAIGSEQDQGVLGIVQATVQKQIPEFLTDPQGYGEVSVYGSKNPLKVVWIDLKQGCEISLFCLNLITNI